MTTAKKPQDNKSGLFSFEHDGETYTFIKSLSFTTKPGFIRKNRRKNEADVMFDILEEVCDEETLAVIDEMETDEFVKLNLAIGEHIEALSGATMGESSGS